MRYFLWVLLFYLGSYPALALDQTDFPIQVYLNPRSQNNNGTSGDPLPPATLAAFRQAVLDWNRLLAAPLRLDDPDKAFLVILSDQQNEADLPQLNKLGLFILTDDPNKADLVVEGINSYQLQNATQRNAGGVFYDGATERIGRIDISLLWERAVPSTLQLRTVLLHELGHALQLGHVSLSRTNQCNLMALSLQRCSSTRYHDCPWRYTYCVELLGWQIAKVNSQLNLMPGQTLDPSYQDSYDYNARVDNQVEGRLYGLGYFSTKGELQIEVGPDGQIRNLKINRSFGTRAFDEKFQSRVRQLPPFGPFPASYHEPTLTLYFDYRPKPELQSYLSKLHKRLKQDFSTLAPPINSGTLALTIDRSGALRNYKFTGDDTRNPEVSSLLSHIFPLKPIPGLHRKLPLRDFFDLAE